MTEDDLPTDSSSPKVKNKPLYVDESAKEVEGTVELLE